MLLVLLFLSIAFVPKPSSAWPIGTIGDDNLGGYEVIQDFRDNYYGPWSTDFIKTGRWLGGPSLSGVGLTGDITVLDVPFRGVGYGGYVPRVDVAKENYIQDTISVAERIESGQRDSLNIRPGGFIAPASPRVYNVYSPTLVQRPSLLRSQDRILNPYSSGLYYPKSGGELVKKIFKRNLGLEDNYLN